MSSISKYIITFLLSLLVLCLVVGETHYYFTYIKPNKHLFDTDKSKHILFLGDSQLECGIDEAYFPEAFNRCKSSDSYLFCFAKLKEMVKHNPQIDTLIVSFSHTSMYPEVDNRMHTEGMEKRLLLYLPYLSLEDIKWFSFTEIGENLVNFLFPSSRPKAETRGGFNRRPSTEFFKIPTYIELSEDTKESLKVSEYKNDCAKFYLSKIENFCKNNNIKLILLTPPVYNTKYRSTFWQEELEKNYSHLPHVNCETMISDSLFYDYSHLNEDGARQFSILLRKLVNNEND